jgi:hypothetical protein
VHLVKIFFGGKLAVIHWLGLISPSALLLHARNGAIGRSAWICIARYECVRFTRACRHASTT